MDGGKSSSFLQFVEIVSCAEEILARCKEMSCLWHGEESCCVAECVGALLYPLGLMSSESSFCLPDANICFSLSGDFFPKPPL